MPHLLRKLKNLARELDDCNPCPPPPKPCPPPCCETPFAQVCFTCPPCGPLPTCPCPVKPLQMPCLPCPPPVAENLEQQMYDLATGYANFYNNYNIDWHRQARFVAKRRPAPRPPCEMPRACGVTVDGQSPCCECVPPTFQLEEPRVEHAHGCPTGFKPCQMRLSAPPCCNPIGVWRARLEPCPPTQGSSPPKPIGRHCV